MDNMGPRNDSKRLFQKGWKKLVRERKKHERKGIQFEKKTGLIWTRRNQTYAYRQKQNVHKK